MSPEEDALARVVAALEAEGDIERWARELGVLDLWQEIAGGTRSKP